MQFNILGSAWKKLSQTFSNDPSVLYLPAFAWFDEFGPMNPLSAHAAAYKIGAIYHKIGVLPKALDAKLSSIHLSDLFFAGDRKNLGNSTILEAFINNANHLQTEGIVIKSHSKIKKVYLMFILQLGDNEGCHIMSGHSTAFGSGKYICLTCRCSREELRSKHI